MANRLIDKILEEVEYRRTVRNWPEDVRTVVDGYRANTTISHAVQKDAIQNGWSARKDKKGVGWSFMFELLEIANRQLLLMSDQGTTGLTGRILTPKEYEFDLPSEEKWGRFEGVAFTQPRSERTLGSRGRGKFIFVGSSKEHTILYDTLRDDAIYRFGFRTVIKTESPIAAFDGEEGKNRLKEMTEDSITPLSTVGTRVIIVDPVEEIIEEIRDGNFLRHISETWWEIILKYGATIKVKADGRVKTATVPKEFELKDEESVKVKIWTKRNIQVPAGIWQVKIKNLKIIYNGSEIPPLNIRGIAFQRDGMKICTIEPKYMGREIAERIYGYVNFDTDTEEDLLEDEGIEHYSYDFRRSLPGAIKRYVEDEILKFAKEKLNYGVNQREVRRQQQLNAERRALVAANSFARALGIGAGPGNKRKGDGGERIRKPVRIQIDELSLPRPNDLRVNYGELVDGIKMRIINDSETEREIRVKLFLRFYDKLLKTFFERDIKVPFHSKTKNIGPYKEKMNQVDYPDKGRYTIVAKITSLMDEDKGTDLDYKTKSFYLEEEPPMRGLFEKCEAFEFPNEEPIKYWMGYSEVGGERGLILYYNVNHPGYTPASVVEDDLSEYILRIAGQEICRYDLMQENPILFKEEDRNEPEEVLKRERSILGELIYKFRRGEV